MTTKSSPRGSISLNFNIRVIVAIVVQFWPKPEVIKNR